MSEAVRETICTHCSHREVCAIEMTYLETLERLPLISPQFDLTLTCKHYQKEVPNPRFDENTLPPPRRYA
jgi:hypothetical protein